MSNNYYSYQKPKYIPFPDGCFLGNSRNHVNRSKLFDDVIVPSLCNLQQQDEIQIIYEGISLNNRLPVEMSSSWAEAGLTPNGYQSVQYHQETHRAFDRITPIVRGILTVLKNLQTLCRCCNYLQGAWV